MVSFPGEKKVKNTDYIEKQLCSRQFYFSFSFRNSERNKWLMVGKHRPSMQE